MQKNCFCQQNIFKKQNNSFHKLTNEAQSSKSAKSATAARAMRQRRQFQHRRRSSARRDGALGAKEEQEEAVLLARERSSRLRARMRAKTGFKDKGLQEENCTLCRFISLGSDFKRLTPGRRI